MLFIDVSVHMLAGPAVEHPPRADDWKLMEGMMAQTADRSLAAKLVRIGCSYCYHAFRTFQCSVQFAWMQRGTDV